MTITGLDAIDRELIALLQADEREFLRRVADAPQVLECHHVTGGWNYLMKVRLPRTRDLESFLADIVKDVPGLQRTETLIVLSSSKETTSVQPPPGR